MLELLISQKQKILELKRQINCELEVVMPLITDLLAYYFDVYFLPYNKKYISYCKAKNKDLPKFDENLVDYYLIHDYSITDDHFYFRTENSNGEMIVQFIPSLFLNENSLKELRKINDKRIEELDLWDQEIEEQKEVDNLKRRK